MATLKTDDGATVELGRELGRGGEGAVHEVEGRPGLCAKVYIPKTVNPQLHDKVRVMAAYPPVDPTVGPLKHHSIAWPTKLLYRGIVDEAHFAGFTMPAIPEKDFKKAICRFHPDDRRKEAGGSFTWLHGYTTARNIASAVAAIHEKGYCIGDINESNILVARDALATMIDCDSFQIRDPGNGRMFRCVVGKGEYSAPELEGKSYSQVDRTPETDHFGLAVLMFQFLMEGCHPYMARGPLVENAGSTEKKISLGHFPYPHPKRPQGVEPPVFAPAFEILHPDIQRLFLRAFVEGHKNPGVRPTSKEWFHCLRGLAKQVVKCAANRNHWYFTHLGKCPWCRLAEKKGNDPYPAPGVKVAAKPKSPRPGPRPAAPPAGVPSGSVVIGLGSFVMGSPEGFGGQDEHPRHRVAVPTFSLEKYPVTVAQYANFAAAAHVPMPAQPSWSSDQHPVVNVTWDEAKAYCGWAGTRLPTEAEWEKAARGGTDTKWHCGDNPGSLGEYAWFSENSGGHAHPVGRKKPNRSGLYDMAGNVWELVEDVYDPESYIQGSSRFEGRVDAKHVCRGGAFDNRANECRPACRMAVYPDFKKENMGFRCVAEAGMTGGRGKAHLAKLAAQLTGSGAVSTAGKVFVMLLAMLLLTLLLANC